MSIRWKFFSYFICPGTVWFRVYGYGLAFRSSEPVLGEKWGYFKVWGIPYTKWRVLLLNHDGVYRG